MLTCYLLNSVKDLPPKVLTNGFKAKIQLRMVMRMLIKDIIS